MTGALRLRTQTRAGAQEVALPVPPGSESATLADVLLAQHIPLSTRCHQRGWCRGCMVELLEGELRLTSGQVMAAPASVRACLVVIDSATAAVVQVPEHSLISARPQVGVSFSIDTPFHINPLFAVHGPRRVAAAIDLGTTTVVVLLVDTISGEILSRAGGLNAQVRYGDNVLTRIMHSATPGGLEQLRLLVIQKTIAPLLREALGLAGCGADTLSGFTVAGNTTMLHLLAGESPESLGFAPFAPRFIDTTHTSAGACGLDACVAGLAGDLPVVLLPGLSGYVGADIAAGLVATGMAFDDEPSLLLDLGTNGELALQRGRRFSVCATAAGPAFEGSGLTSGTRAEDGAIADLAFTLNPFAIQAGRLGQAKEGPARGICGSAYLDFLAQGVTLGFLTATGRFAADWWAQLPGAYRCEVEGARALRLGSEAAAPLVSEGDVARLLQAKAAIGAGVETLLLQAGLQARDIRRLYLAGGFGLHLNVRHAIAIGLLPGFTPEQVRVVGNSALAGAVLAALDREALAEMESLRARTEVVELNHDPLFEDRYIDHLALTRS